MEIDLDHDSCYRIFQARDARFDGRVFIAVRTTGIYCRPICPARTPKSGNVTFFASATAAREAGFRPCLRCRPEVAPELAAWNGTSSTVARALRLIDTGSLDAPDIERLAEQLGIGARQLRRLFARHVGASPNAVLQTRRIHFAKQLIQDTRMPMTQVAFASGFSSIRRFNETFKDLFGRPPSSLRRSRASDTGAGSGSDSDVSRGITLRLAYAAPYAWDQLLAFLSARAIPGIEAVTGDSFARSVSVDGDRGDHGVIAVAPGRAGRAGELTLRVHCLKISALPAIIGGVRRMFDLAADPRAIDAHLAADPLLAPLVSARPGLRVAGAWSGFELSVRAVLHEWTGARRARERKARLVECLGASLHPTFHGLYPGVTHVFPTPAAVSESDLIGLGPGLDLGLSAAQADVLKALAGRKSFDGIGALVGESPAQYVAMRALREPDAFPAADATLLRAVEAISGRRLSPAQLLARAERWRPWRAYAAAHLWASLQSPQADRLTLTSVA